MIEELRKYQEEIANIEYTCNLLKWELRINAPKKSQNDLVNLISYYDMKVFNLKTSDEYGKILYDVREILETLCEYKQVDIIAGAVCIDHVHLSVAIPPKLSVSQFMGYLKGKSTLMIYDRHPELQSKWNKAFWARGYYVETIGNITDEAVQKYIKEQAEESRKEDSGGTAL